MRDFTEDLADVARRVREAHHYLGIDEARERLAGARGRSVGARSLGRSRPRAQGQRRALGRARRRRAGRRPRTPASPTCRRCSTSRAKRATSRVEPEIATELDDLRRTLDRLELRALFSGEHDERDAICEVHSGAGGTDAQDWTAMLLRMFTRWARVEGLRGRDRRDPRGPGGRHHVARPSSSRVATRTACSPGERGVHRLIRISPFDANAPPPDRVRVVRLRARARGDRRARHRPERPPHRHVPLVGRGRPARERHRLRGAHHAPADRHRRVVPERAVADAEQGQGDADPRGPPRRARPRGAPQGARSALGRQARRRVRQPDPHVHARSVPAREGRAHARRDRQRAGRDRRRPRPVHRGVPPVAAQRRRRRQASAVPRSQGAEAHLVPSSGSHDSIRERQQDLQGRCRRSA